MVQIILIMLAAACWAVMSHLIFHNRKTGAFQKHKFFGAESWKRKYKKAQSKQGILSAYDLYDAPDNIYYDIFGIEHEEKFPWSATALVFLTDGVHLFQWLMFKFIFLAMTLTYSTSNRTFHFDWIQFVLLWAAWGLVFSVVFKKLKK